LFSRVRIFYCIQIATVIILVADVLQEKTKSSDCGICLMIRVTLTLTTNLPLLHIGYKSVVIGLTRRFTTNV
jgi:hypothetical protein